ncbi:MAG: diguanylate cyclase [Desulfovibrionaceae bacterium]|nr:diguanylate cyclase [Desulfovibrionaceae bacterium]
MEKSTKGTQRRFALIASLVMLHAAFFILCIFYWLYDSSKQNILGSWRNEMQQATQKIHQYLKMPIDAVAFSGVTINRMLREQATHTEVGAYVVNETAIYSSIISENNTGVYCFYKGVYLDGSGWVPPADYKPRERPWYTAALQGKGKIVLVEPFFNLQTNTMMTSVSQLLDDKDSVVSMDIFLDSIQNMVERMAAGSIVEKAFVLDRSGIVVAHSQTELVGKNLKHENIGIQPSLLHKIEAHGVEHYECTSYDGKYTIFAEPISTNWRAVYILNEDRLYISLVVIYLASGFFLLFILSTSFIVFLKMSRKYAEADRLSKEIHAVAKIYDSMVRVNLKDDTIACVQSSKNVDALLEGDFTHFSSRAIGFAETMSAEQSKDIMKNFMDPATLEERLRDSTYITQEFMDTHDCWVRLRIIVIDRAADNSLQHILLAFESIDEYRKKQEKLRKLSETDLMTGVRNRGSGERLIRRAMAERQCGMFCLMDADKFKSINDQYGHAVGDKVIIAIAQCLKETFRDSDIIFRLGGDEFAAFSIGVVDIGIAQRIMQRLFSHIDKIDIPEMKGRTISLSVGVTIYPATCEDSFEEMYKRADSGTYASKKVAGNKATFVLQGN